MSEKFALSKLLGFFPKGDKRRAVAVFLRYAAFLSVTILAYASLFQWIMVQVEGRSHSWVTAFYWTLVTMSTVGFGDVVFYSDIGRVFSLVVLVSGIMLLLVVLPFTFIRFFYAPWLEAQLLRRVPQKVSPNVRGHVIVSRYNEIAVGLIERLQFNKIPYYVVESDPAAARRLLNQGISVVLGEFDNRTTYEDLQVHQARLLLANCEDTTNANITLTAREVSKDVPIVGIVEEENSTDILELSGCTHVFPLKVRLGEYLANRVSGLNKIDVIGSFRGLKVCEVSVRNTPMADATVRDSKFRERTGMNIVGVWNRGKMMPAYPDTWLRKNSIAVLAGASEQLVALNDWLGSSLSNEAPIMIIGAGTVGRVAMHRLKQKGLSVHVVDRDPGTKEHLEGVADHIVIGNANDRKILERAGINDVSAVLLSTNDDAVSVYLTVYCRKLRPDLRIASRITHERNLESIQRAGADFVLSYSSLGVESIESIIDGHEPVIFGAGIDLFELPVPASLDNKTLSESRIGSRTGLSVIAIQQGGQLVTTIMASMQLVAGAKLIMCGNAKQRRNFGEAFD